jgi:hypothetical protein
MKKEIIFEILLLLTFFVYSPSNVLAVMEVPDWVQEEYRKDKSSVTGNGSGPADAGKVYPTKINASSSPMTAKRPVVTSQVVPSVTPHFKTDPTSTPVSTMTTVSASEVPKNIFQRFTSSISGFFSQLFKKISG